jgi:hypothetical protein
MTDLQELLEEFARRRAEPKELLDRMDDVTWALHSLLILLVEMEGRER